MKRLFSLIVLLGFLGVVTGCDQGGDGSTTADTNAPASAVSTNK